MLPQILLLKITTDKPALGPAARVVIKLGAANYWKIQAEARDGVLAQTEAKTEKMSGAERENKQLSVSSFYLSNLSGQYKSSDPKSPPPFS